LFCFVCFFVFSVVPERVPPITGAKKKRRRSLTIDLRSVTTSVGADADVNSSEPLGSEKEQGLPDLQAESLGLSKVQGNTVDLDHSLALLAVGNSGGGFLILQ